jgi:hypothetical protein
MKYLVILALIVTCVGCAATEPRNGPESDDVIYVKAENTVYSRYINVGGFLIPNIKLIKRVGQISTSNDKIVIYEDYAAMKKSGINFAIDVSVTF